MKKIYLLIMAAMLITGCSKSETEPDIVPQPEPVKEYIVSLSFSGEITNIEESPLTRAVPNDLYGIQVYSMPATETDQSKYKPYAYGQFDDKSKMTIKLLEGYKYKFVSTMVVDGKNKMRYGFFIAGGGGAFGETTNAYTYSSDRYFSQLNQSGLYIKSDGKEYDRPNLDRYYGESVDYVPTENGTISINMKRVVFGVKIIAEDMNEGTIAITIEDAPIMSITYPETTVEDIYTFKGVYLSLSSVTDDYTETIPLSASWEKADGATIPLVSKEIEFKRNKLTTITIKVKDNSVNNGVDVSPETTPMGDGGNIIIDTSSNSDTGVSPNP